VPRHLPSLDGLRAIAVSLVLWQHVRLSSAGYPLWLEQARWLVNPGNLGVELFFALSGFLITRILLAEHAAGHPVRWFVLRRMLRIFPIYYLLLLVMAAWRPASELGWCALYLSNFVDVFAPTAGAKPLGHTWTLCVEEHFYLLWPLAIALGGPARARRILTWIVIPAAAIGAVAVGVAMEQRAAELAVERLSPFRFLTLACGALLAFAEPEICATGRRPRDCGLMTTAVALALHPHIWFLVVPIFVVGATWWPFGLAPAWWRVHSALLSVGVLMWALTPPGVLMSPARALSLAPLRALGRISYGVYLYHLPIYHWLLWPDPSMTNAGFAIAVTLAVATASYLLIERPILQYAARFRGRTADR
jgi:peptidoglycan/LPS O-acetylase OafA/YrhL